MHILRRPLRPTKEAPPFSRLARVLVFGVTIAWPLAACATGQVSLDEMLRQPDAHGWAIVTPDGAAEAIALDTNAVHRVGNSLDVWIQTATDEPREVSTSKGTVMVKSSTENIVIDCRNAALGTKEFVYYGANGAVAHSFKFPSVTMTTVLPSTRGDVYVRSVCSFVDAHRGVIR